MIQGGRGGKVFVGSEDVTLPLLCVLFLKEQASDSAFGGKPEHDASAHLLHPLLSLWIRKSTERESAHAGTGSERRGKRGEELTFLLKVARSWLYTSAIEATSASSAADQGRVSRMPVESEGAEEALTVRLLQQLHQGAEDCAGRTVRSVLSYLRRRAVGKAHSARSWWRVSRPRT